MNKREIVKKAIEEVELRSGNGSESKDKTEVESPVARYANLLKK